MKPEQWQKVKGLFDAVVELSPAERNQFPIKSCGTDERLRREVEKLLDSFEEAESFMEKHAKKGVASAIIKAGAKNLEAGKCFGHYEIVRQIGAGGMGEVYLAQDKKLDRQVAVKILNETFAKNESNLQRFIREARAASALNHPNILVIHEIGEDSETNYIVSEFVEGKTLREILKEKSLELKEVLDVVIQVANALSAAHQAHIVHRDIKPENIMIRPDGYVKILDFGLAKLIEQKTIGLEDATVKQNQTAQGIILGTVNYMSPEQAKGEKVDEQTDIFSFGVLLYEMIAGKTPFAADSMSETFANLIKIEPLMLSHYAANVPDELQRIVFKMLKKNKAERYQTMREAANDLRELQQSGTNSQARVSSARNTAAPTELTQQQAGNTSAKTKRPQWLVLSVSSLLLLAIIGFGIYHFRRVSPVEETIDSIAVLPFTNSSNDPNLDYLSDGITESIIGNLSQLPKLKVMSRNSVFRFKGKNVDAQTAGKQLNVRAVLTGSVRQIGNNFSIYVEVLNTNDGSSIWQHNYTINSSDILTTQNDIARETIANLRVKLDGQEQQQIAKRPTENADAYQLFLKGRFYAQQGTPEGLNKSIELYRQALEKDPNFALAYSELAMRYVLLGIYFLPPRETMPEAKKYAQRALEIDKNLPDPHSVLGVVALLYDWDWDTAKTELAKGSAVAPQSLEAFSCSAHILQATGRTSEADTTLRGALEDDPLSSNLNTELGCNSYYARRYEDSIAQYREVLNIEPHNFIALYGLARSLNQKGQYSEAVSEIEKAKTFLPMLPPVAVAEEGYADAKMGKLAEAEKELKTLDAESKQIYVDPFFKAVIYQGLDDQEKTFAQLEKAYEAKSGLMPTLINDIKWDDLRSDPRFQDFMDRLKVKSNVS